MRVLGSVRWGGKRQVGSGAPVRRMSNMRGVGLEAGRRVRDGS